MLGLIFHKPSPTRGMICKSLKWALFVAPPVTGVTFHVHVYSSYVRAPKITVSPSRMQGTRL